MTKDSRITIAMSDMLKTSEILINALISVVPSEHFAAEDVQQAMLTYLEGSSKFQADAAMFMAQSKVSNG